MLSSSCRMVATRMKKNSWWLQENCIAVLFLNEHDKKNIFMSFELLFLSLSNLILKMNSCVDISCCFCCMFSVSPSQVYFASL